MNFFRRKRLKRSHKNVDDKQKETREEKIFGTDVTVKILGYYIDLCVLVSFDILLAFLLYYVSKIKNDHGNFSIERRTPFVTFIQLNACKDNKFLHLDRNQCVNTCPADQVALEGDIKRCSCGPNQGIIEKLHPTGNKKYSSFGCEKCKSTAYIFNDLCVFKCPEHSETLNASSNVCKCEGALFKPYGNKCVCILENSRGECVSKCDASYMIKKTYNNNVCACPPNTNEYEIEWEGQNYYQCRFCPPGSFYYENRCEKTCPEGTKPLIDKYKETCTLVNPSINDSDAKCPSVRGINKKCADTCGEYQQTLVVEEENQCSCKEGFTIKTKTSNSDDMYCGCKDGYAIDQGSCVKLILEKVGKPGSSNKQKLGIILGSVSAVILFIIVIIIFVIFKMKTNVSLSTQHASQVSTVNDHMIEGWLDEADIDNEGNNDDII